MTEIRIPYRDEDDLTIEVVDAAGEVMDGDELRVTEQIAFDALGRGITKVGDLIGELEAAGPDGRRKLVDEARQSLGMKTLGAEEADKEFKRRNAALPPARDAEGRRFMGCAAENCNAYPQDEQGVPTPVVDRVWWCDRHRDQAGPDDHLPPEPEYVLDMRTMSLKAVGAEQERLLEEDRKLQEKARERTERQHAEGERLRKLEAEYQATLKPPVGFAPR